MSEYDLDNVVKDIMKAIKKERDELKTLNVMVLGKTGVGKSTLINNMFSENLAETGVGKPVTQKIRKIEKEGFPLTIYDTPGLEIGGEFAVDSLLDEVCEEINRGIKTGDISEAIHCIWYCVNTASHRFEETETSFLNKFRARTSDYDIPVIIVLTKSYSKHDAKILLKEIEKENLPIVKIVPVLAENYEIDDEYTAKAYGLDKLSLVMENIVPEAVKQTFIVVQKANIELKQKKARAIVATSASLAAATGAAPIPFSDAAVLVPNQIAMLSGITATFGMEVEKSTITSIISATIGTVGTTVLGKTIVSNLLKIIPGVGTLTGGLISSATAATLTAALGESYIVVMTKLATGEYTEDELKEEKGKNEISKIFTDFLKRKKKKSIETDE